MKKEENHFFIATDCKNDKVGKPSARGCAIPWELQGESGIFSFAKGKLSKAD